MRRAQAWLDRELRRDPNYDPDAPEANLSTGGVVEFEQALRNGVALAKLARVFDGKEAVPRIYTVSLSWLTIGGRLVQADSVAHHRLTFIRRPNSPTRTQTTSTTFSSSYADATCPKCLSSWTFGLRRAMSTDLPFR